MRHVIIGTAGHVDHGKTTLIKALTGTDPDRLAEEQARGMTIDLGFAMLTLPNQIQAGIVDVPGHERFVKNMLAGTGGVDVALLIVAADEGPMPQTREHLDILTTLGVHSGVVALTKIDLADPELRELAELETRSALAKTTLADAPIIAVSAATGAGLEALLDALAIAAENAPLRSASAPLRLPIDRVFSLPGIGTVATGTLVSGTLSVGDAVALEPQGLLSKARTLQNHSAKIERATPGMRIAVNLPGIDVGQIERGSVLCAPNSLASTTLIDVRLSVLESVSRPLKHRERVRLHLGTGEILARTVLLNGAEIASGVSDVAVQFLLESAAAPARGERFVIRTYSPAHAIGGGIIVDPKPARKYRRGDEAAIALFEAHGAGTLEDSVYAQLTARHEELTVSELAKSLGTDPEAALENLVDSGRAFVIGGERYLSDLAAQRLRETAIRALKQHHQQNPLKKGMPQSGLRAPLAKAAGFKDFNAIIAFLLAENVCVLEVKNHVRLPEFEAKMPEHWQKAADHLLTVYQSAGFTPPDPKDFQANYPRDVSIASILMMLTEDEKLVKIADELYLSREAFETARQAIRKLAKTPDGITVGSLRDALGSSRKIILPLLEHLDGVRFTKRVGDTRVLAESEG
jgi:selenocysteine-specific elongation factor